MPVPHLPLELVERILSFAFPDPAPGKVWLPRTPYRERRKIGSIIACVCRAWRPLGLKLAWRNLGVSLRTNEDVKQFEEILAGRCHSSYVRTAVIHVVTEPPSAYPPRRIDNFLAVCPHIETLALWNSSMLVSDFLSLPTMSSAAQKTASNLKHLELRQAPGDWDPQHILRFALPSLPNLSSLILAYPCFVEPLAADTGSKSGAKRVLPSLQHLELSTASDPPRWGGERLTIKNLAPFVNVDRLTSFKLILFHPPNLMQLSSLLAPTLLSLTIVVNDADAQSYLSNLCEVLFATSKLQHFRLETILHTAAYPWVPPDFPAFLKALPTSLVSSHIDLNISPAALNIVSTAFLPSRLASPLEKWSCRAVKVFEGIGPRAALMAFEKLEVTGGAKSWVAW
ncbi:hypothetical protein JCM6882_000409 [Rhodosporidiobolus microsporus]